MCVCVYTPVLARATGMRRLVGIARVLGFIVHVWGRWAGFVDPGSAPVTLGCTGQLSFALGEGFGRESKRQLQQLNFTPERIYFGGRRDERGLTCGKKKKFAI